MNNEDFKLWTEIRPKNTVTYYQRTVMAELMTKYYNWKHKVPCACPATIKEIVTLLDKLNDNRTSVDSGIKDRQLESNDGEQPRSGGNNSEGEVVSNNIENKQRRRKNNTRQKRLPKTNEQS